MFNQGDLFWFWFLVSSALAGEYQLNVLKTSPCEPSTITSLVGSFTTIITCQRPVSPIPVTIQLMGKSKALRGYPQQEPSTNLRTDSCVLALPSQSQKNRPEPSRPLDSNYPSVTAISTLPGSIILAPGQLVTAVALHVDPVSPAPGVRDGVKPHASPVSGDYTRSSPAPLISMSPPLVTVGNNVAPLVVVNTKPQAGFPTLDGPTKSLAHENQPLPPVNPPQFVETPTIVNSLPASVPQMLETHYRTPNSAVTPLPESSFSLAAPTIISTATKVAPPPTSGGPTQLTGVANRDFDRIGAFMRVGLAGVLLMWL